MAIRIPRIDVEMPSFSDIPAISWHSLDCELVTPMYGGGVKSTIIDEKMPIRATGIRGQLRFWWRLLAKQVWYPIEKPEIIRQKEFALWGGISVGEDDGKAGLVLLRVTDQPTSEMVNRNLKEYREVDLPYVLFPAANETDNELMPHRLLMPENITWVLKIAFLSYATEDQRKQVWEAIRWWANFGGVGSRTRRGLGAVYVSSEELPQINENISESEIQAAGCQFARKKPATLDAMGALKTAIKQLSEFRQGVNIGRNQGRQDRRPGRSRWPEPDALRRINNTHASNHQPAHPAGNIFPRALFGLPIVYHFVGRGEPGDTNVIMAQGERLASPLILRPFCEDMVEQGQRKWCASALLLPYEHIMNMSVSVNHNSYSIWSADAARHIAPVKDNAAGNGRIDPLQAFLNFFAK